MATTPVISIEKDQKWENWHKSIHVGGKVNQLLTPFNKYEDNTKPPIGKEFLPGLEGLELIVKRAQANKMKVRAHGSKWSLNDVAFTNSYLVDSRKLGFFQIGIDEPNFVTNSYQQKKKFLSFVQCGVMVRTLNVGLVANDQALPTSGASDGQTLIGAISTGTHGGANQVGSMTEYVKGIHLVIPGKHIFIQRESDQAVTQEYCDWLGGAELILDDALFNSALVGFGSFGMIHGLLIETETNYWLQRYIKNYDYSEVKKAMTDLDMTGLGLPEGDKLPFHFEIALNPYRLEDGGKGAFVRVYYKYPLDDDIKEHKNDQLDSVPDIHTGIGESMDGSKEEKDKHIETDDEPHSGTYKFIRWAVEVALKTSFPETEPSDMPDIKQPSEFFTGKNSADPTSSVPIPATSLEIGIPLNRIEDAVNLIHNVVQEHPFAAPLALRYVKQSSAAIGFTGLAPITVTMEMPGPYGHVLFPKTGKAHQAIFDALADSDIPHSYHWGQQLPKNPDWVRKAYGNKLIEWKEQRLKLLGEEGLKIFSNDFIESFLEKRKAKSLFRLIFDVVMGWFGRKPVT